MKWTHCADIASKALYISSSVYFTVRIDNNSRTSFLRYTCRFSVHFWGCSTLAESSIRTRYIMPTSLISLLFKFKKMVICSSQIKNTALSHLSDIPTRIFLIASLVKPLCRTSARIPGAMRSQTSRGVFLIFLSNNSLKRAHPMLCSSLINFSRK